MNRPADAHGWQDGLELVEPPYPFDPLCPTCNGWGKQCSKDNEWETCLWCKGTGLNISARTFLLKE